TPSTPSESTPSESNPAASNPAGLPHPQTGALHLPVPSGQLTFVNTPSPIYPPGAYGDPSLPEVVRCTARLWSRADGTVETAEVLDCPPVFVPLWTTALEQYVFHADDHPGEPLVTEVVTEFTRPDGVRHPVTKQYVPVAVDAVATRERRPKLRTAQAASCRATLFVPEGGGYVDAVDVDKDCPALKAVAKAALGWRFAPWSYEGEPSRFAVVVTFEVDAEVPVAPDAR
ncbi:MAG: hypothetical protein ABMB14_30630, partial [Myxococcota bacterium]